MNNPFNMKVGDQTQQYITNGQASVGRAAPDGGNFLTFKDRNSAITAAQGLLFNSGVYKGLTVDAALKKWSNNGYGGNVVPDLSGKNLDELTPDEQTQVLNAMETKGENDAVAPGVKRVSDFKQGQLSVVTPTAKPTTPVQPQSFADKMASGYKNNVVAPLQNFSQAVAKTEVNTAQNLGETVLNGTDALGITKNQSNDTFFQDPNALKQKTDPASVAGEVVGTVAPYFTGAGEEEAAALGAKTLASTGSKVAAWLAPHLVTGAANTAIGTSQSGSVKQGAEQAVGAEVGQAALGKVGSYIAKSGERVLARITDALTPRVVGKGYIKAATSGTKIAPPSIFGKAGIEGDAMKDVQNSLKAVQNVATALGKKTTDIVKSGTAQVTKNFNRINDTIGQYAQGVVKPFLQKSGVNYNFTDLRNALEIVKPSGDLKGKALSTYNQVREQILSAVANKVSPETKGGTSLTALRKMSTDGRVVPTKVPTKDPDFWDARKIIDDIGNEVTKGKIFGSEAHAGATKAWSDLRAAYKNYLSDAFRYPGQMDKVNKANSTLATQEMKGMNKAGWDISQFEKQFGLTPSIKSEEESKEWDTHMANLEGLFQGRNNIATHLNEERGKDAVELWMKAHPKITATAKNTAVAGASALGLGAGYAAFEKIMGAKSGGE